MSAWYSKLCSLSLWERRFKHPVDVLANEQVKHGWVSDLFHAHGHLLRLGGGAEAVMHTWKQGLSSAEIRSITWEGMHSVGSNSGPLRSRLKQPHCCGTDVSCCHS